jgi:hypothetical protein
MIGSRGGFYQPVPLYPPPFPHTLLTMPRAPEPETPQAQLESDIQRLIRKHGWEAVAKTAKKLAKPNKRRDLEDRDFKVLGPLIRESVENALQGKPRVSNMKMAEAALPHIIKTSIPSGHSRMMTRLRSLRRKQIEAVLSIEAAADRYSCEVLYSVCVEGAKIKGLEDYANRYLNELADAIDELDKAGTPIPSGLMLAELRSMAEKARAARTPVGLNAAWLANLARGEAK